MELNTAIWKQHRQIAENSCVAMGVEAVLKLNGAMRADDFSLQEKLCANPCDWNFGGKYQGFTYGNIRFKFEFDHERNPDFPLKALFCRIESELDEGRLVLIALQPTLPLFHEYVVFERAGNEFNAVTWFHNAPDYKIEEGIRGRLEEIQGSDILTYVKLD